MVMIAAFQAVGPGSIPGCRIFYFLFFLFFFIRKILIDLRDKNEINITLHILIQN